MVQFNVHSRGVIPKPRVFTSGARACSELVEGDRVEHYFKVTHDCSGELLRVELRTLTQEDAMRAYLAHLTPKARILLAIPVLALAYPVVMILVPAIVRALVPDVVRSVLNLI